MNIKENKDGTTISVFVKPNSSEFVVERNGDEIVMYSTEIPAKGKVNKEILKEASKLFSCKVEIISGLTSRQKVLLIRGANKARVIAVLEGKVVAKGA